MLTRTHSQLQLSAESRLTLALQIYNNNKKVNYVKGLRTRLLFLSLARKSLLPDLRRSSFARVISGCDAEDTWLEDWELLISAINVILNVTYIKRFTVSWLGHCLVSLAVLGTFWLICLPVQVVQTEFVRLQRLFEAVKANRLLDGW